MKLEWCVSIIMKMCSVSSKAVWPKIGAALLKIDSTGFVRMSKKDTFSWQFSQFSAEAYDFGAKTVLIFVLVKLSQAQNS